MNRAVLLASGGLDSTTLCYWLIRENYEVFPLFLDYGQHAAEKELETLREVLPSKALDNVHVARVRDIFCYSQSRLINEADLWRDEIAAEHLIVPYRNVFLLTAGAAYASSRGIIELHSAFINSNHAIEIDATDSFLMDTAKLIGSTNGVSLKMPFRGMSKKEVAKLGCELDAPIGLTFSCQANSVIHCGACPNCIDRTEALAACAASEAV